MKKLLKEFWHSWTLLAIGLSFMIAGCFEARIAPILGPAYQEQRPSLKKPPAEAPPTSREQAAADAAHEDVADLKGRLAKAEERADVLDKQAQRAETAHIRALGLWMAGLAFIGAAGATAAAVFLPVFRTRLALGAVACLAVMVLALTVNAVLDWLPVIGAVIFAGGFAVMVGWLIKYRIALRETGKAADALANAPLAQMKTIKRGLLAKQIDLGVHKLIADARGKAVKTLKDLETQP